MHYNVTKSYDYLNPKKLIQTILMRGRDDDADIVVHLGYHRPGFDSTGAFTFRENQVGPCVE